MQVVSLWQTVNMCHLQPLTRPMRRPAQGFTLIEVMVVVALIAILATLAAPSWNQMQTRASIRSLVNDYTMSILLTRSEAVRLNAPVTICPSNNGINCTNSELDDGWIVAIGVANDPAPRVLQDHAARDHVRTGFANQVRTITFLPNGQPSGLPIQTVRVCPVKSGMETLSRNIVVNQTGRSRVTEPGVCEIP